MGLKKLSPRHRAFIEIYLTSWNASHAAREVGYKQPGLVGAQMLREPVVKEFIRERLAEMTMEADEVLTRLSQQASASVEDFVRFEDDDGNPVPPYLDLDKARREGKMHLLRRVKFAPVLEVELHDSQAALVHLGRAHKLFTDKLDVSGVQNESYHVHIYIPSNGREIEVEPNELED